MSLHWGALRSLAVPPFQLHRFRLRQPAAAVRRLLARQMGLESLADGWRWRDDGELWRLEPQRGTSAAF